MEKTIVDGGNSIKRPSMNRHCFDMLWRHVRWSHQPDVRGEGMSHESHRWKIVEDFVTHFNEYRTQLFSPLGLICADESISQWYGQGGHWINLGLPMYVVMDRKPENGAEIQNSACEWSGIMMRLRIVKSAKNEEEHQDNRDNLPHGTYNFDAFLCSLQYVFYMKNEKEKHLNRG